MDSSLMILVADDDEEMRRGHRYAVEAAMAILQRECLIIETKNSVETWEQMQSQAFDLILLDNDFKDRKLHDHLPGVAILQLARREGLNKTTPIIFCSGETFETLGPMVERFGGILFPKAGYDLEAAAKLFAEQISKSRTSPG